MPHVLGICLPSHRPLFCRCVVYVSQSCTTAATQIDVYRQYFSKVPVCCDTIIRIIFSCRIRALAKRKNTNFIECGNIGWFKYLVLSYRCYNVRFCRLPAVFIAPMFRCASLHCHSNKDNARKTNASFSVLRGTTFSCFRNDTLEYGIYQVDGIFFGTRKSFFFVLILSKAFGSVLSNQCVLKVLGVEM